MAECSNDKKYEKVTTDVIMEDCSETEDENTYSLVSTQNRFVENKGHASGRGNSWQTVRRAKRKKVSSGGTDTFTDIIDIQSFNNLPNEEKLSNMFEVVFKVFHIMNDVRNEQTKFYETSRDLKSSVNQLREHVQKTEKVSKQQTKCIKMLAYRSIDSEARSRRNNLVIWGVSERINIRSERLILNFLEDEMSVDTSEMVIDRAHRMGPSNTQSNRHTRDPKRPIVVRFRDYIDTDIVMKNAYKLKGTPFGVDRDYPREIAMARKELYRSDEARQARERRCKVQIRYPAKLFINGILVDDKFPEWHRYLNQNRMTCIEFEESTDQNETVYEMDTEVSGSSEEETDTPANDSVFHKPGENKAAVPTVTSKDRSGHTHLPADKGCEHREPRASHTGTQHIDTNSLPVNNGPNSNPATDTSVKNPVNNGAKSVNETKVKSQGAKPKHGNTHSENTCPMGTRAKNRTLEFPPQSTEDNTVSHNSDAKL